jgi:hypothetical protein
MATITVYPFKYYDPKNGIYKMGSGMATEETISKIEGAIIIRSEAIDIDDSELTQSERYYEPATDE